jgi:hypothetical protein
LLRSYHIAKNGNWRLNRSIKKWSDTKIVTKDNAK